MPLNKSPIIILRQFVYTQYESGVKIFQLQRYDLLVRRVVLSRLGKILLEILGYVQLGLDRSKTEMMNKIENLILTEQVPILVSVFPGIL